ncbi:MAG: tol-pal system protein YbgF [Devosiaceae bacterium]|nr:tol-pal system protein YbgF [Devosiaceae bacterium]
MTLFRSGPGRASLFSVVLMAGVLAPAFVSAGSGNDVASRINVLEFQTQNLSDSLNALNSDFGLPALTIQPNTGSQTNVLVAQNRSTAAMNLRLSQVEEQMRVLNGQVEGLQFQMAQMQTLIERMQEDNEFRFAQLEGGGAGKTDAVTQSGGDRPVGELPQNENLDENLDENQNQQAQTVLEPVALEHPAPGTAILETTDQGFQSETDEYLGVDLQEAPVPMIFNGGDRASFELPPTLLGEGTPLDLEFLPGDIVSDGDAEAQYRAGLDAILQGDYQFAESQFRQFVELFPDHDLAPEATNWFGEALLRQSQFDEAARVLLDGFEEYQDTTRGPDLLLKLGIALNGAGEHDTACRTFGEVLRRYSDMDGAFELRVAAEMARAQC